MISPRRKQSERGYALLLVFLMAGAIALMLYKEMPRVAFESEREKEQLLIDRGQQYVRAIQLYYTANRKFPLAIEDLEQRDKRFLRRRYVDPYTGKDEWRLVHGNGSTLTDSLVQTAPATTTTGSNTQQQQQTPVTLNADGTPAVNAAVLARPSDRPLNLPPGISYVAGDANNANADLRNAPLPPITLTPQNAVNPANIAQGNTGNQALPPITLVPGAGAPGANNLGNLSGNPSGNPAINPSLNQGNPALPPITLGFTPPGGVGAPNVRSPQAAQNPQGGLPLPGVQPGGAVPGGVTLPGGFRIDANGQPVATSAPGAQGLPGGLPGLPQQGQQNPNQPGDSSAALNIINQILTQPRTPVTQNAPITGQNNTFGVGIAGVASTHTGPSIKVYNDQSEYELWEFVYQIGTGVGAGLPQGNNGPPGVPPGNTPRNPNGQQGAAPFGNNPFGQNPGQPGPVIQVPPRGR